MFMISMKHGLWWFPSCCTVHVIAISFTGAKNEETYQRAAHKHKGRALYVIKRMSATIMNVTLR